MFSPACCATSTNWTPDGVGFDAAASTTSGFFHFQSGVVSASVSALPNTKREDPRKRRRGKIIDGNDYSDPIFTGDWSVQHLKDLHGAWIFGLSVLQFL